MSENDDTRGRSSSSAEEWQAIDGGLVRTDVAPEPELAAPASSPMRGALGVLGVLAGVLAGSAVFALAVGATATWAASGAPVAVPELAGGTAATASSALAARGLADGRASWVVTRQFPAGRILDQSPAAGTSAAPGSKVNIRIAVASKQLTLPDLSFLAEADARQAAESLLLEPQVAYVYTKDIETGRVVEQLPRPGDSAMTGSPLTIVVSLGPGTGGARVPALLGRMLPEARSIAASATLFPVERAVDAPGIADGTVVDQAPSPGSTVPVTSDLVLSVAIARSAQAQ